MTKSLDSASRYKNIAETKLASLETKDGKLDFEAHLVAEAADSMLKENPAYIGVSPFGSAVRGYSDENSDVDLAIFFDPSFLQGQLGAEKLVANTRDQISEKKLTSRNIHCLGTFVDKTALFATLKSYNFSDVTLWLYIFSPNAIGPRVEEYRRMVADEIRNEPQEKKEQIINKLARAIVYGEREAIGKIRRRIPNATLGQLNTILSRREKLWSKQIESILNSA